MKKTMNYKESYSKLVELVEELENGEIDLEDLSTKVNEANELMAICEKKLRNVEKEITKTQQKKENE